MLRDKFNCPKDKIYFCGHSLGLQPKSVQSLMDIHLKKWSEKGIRGWFEGDDAWYELSDRLRAPLAKLVGTDPSEVVIMNSLTVNLHLMLTSFYQPMGKKRKILIDGPPFPSDRYALQSHLESSEDLLILDSIDNLEATLQEKGDEIALVFLNGIHFLTGEFYDCKQAVILAKKHGCKIGFDLAHAIGNVPLQLSDWEADFAVWCHYKYVNAGPGAVGGAFVNKKYHKNSTLPRLSGWWGKNPSARFQGLHGEVFEPDQSAAGWQLSTPSLFATLPLQASLELFKEVGMDRLREKSLKLSSLLLDGLSQIKGIEILTPADPTKRGSMVSIKLDSAKELVEKLQNNGIICDFRMPDVVRLTPHPLYNAEEEVRQVLDTIRQLLS